VAVFERFPYLHVSPTRLIHLPRYFLVQSSIFLPVVVSSPSPFAVPANVILNFLFQLPVADARHPFDLCHRRVSKQQASSADFLPHTDHFTPTPPQYSATPFHQPLCGRLSFTAMLRPLKYETRHMHESPSISSPPRGMISS